MDERLEQVALSSARAAHVSIDERLNSAWRERADQKAKWSKVERVQSQLELRSAKGQVVPIEGAPEAGSPL